MLCHQFHTLPITMPSAQRILGHGPAAQGKELGGPRDVTSPGHRMPQGRQASSTPQS